MASLFLKGCGTALVTPFKMDGSVDYEAYVNLVKRQVNSGVDFLVPLATTAETPTLSLEEKKKLYSLTRENAPGKTLLVGVGSNSVEGTMANIREFPDADAYLVVVPFYNKPTQQGMYLYYKAICEASDKPVVIYNVPGRTGANMSAETAVRIAREVPGIIGIKEASGKLDQVIDMIKGAPEGFSILSGDDDMTLDILRNGGHGVISVASNVLPAQVAEMVRAYHEGCIERAEELHNALMPLFKGCFVESNPIPAKEALRQLGYCTNKMRLPLTEAVESTSNTINEILSQWK